MARSIGIDLSWAATGRVVLDGPIVPSDTDLLPTEPENFRHRYERVRYIARAVVDYVATWRSGPDTVLVLEGYSFGSSGKGKQKQSMEELGGVVRTQLLESGFDFWVCPPTTLKQFVTSKGTATKDIMLREVYKRWKFETDDHNINDAYALAQLGRMLATGSDTQAFQKLLTKLEHIK